MDQQDRGRPRAGGFTLVEVLVVVVIVGVLIALLLVGLHSSRESSRRAQCVDNLRRIALGLSQYQAANEQLPTGATWQRCGFRQAVTYHAAMSPQVSILPQLEQGAIYNRWNFQVPTINEDNCVPGGDANLTARNWRLSSFLCPSNPDPEATMGYRMVSGSNPYFMPSVNPEEEPDPPADLATIPNGMFYYNSFVGLQAIADGTGHTAMATERLVGPGWGKYGRTFMTIGGYGLLGAPGWCASADPNFFAVGHGTSSSMTLIPFARTPNVPLTACLGALSQPGDGVGMVDGPSSMHSGGVNVAFADGSVKFVTDGVNPAVWQALATVSGGETVDESSF